MLPKLDAQHKRINQKLDEALNYLEHLQEEKLHAAGTGQWSAAQIIYHLLTAETGTTNYLKKKMLAPPEEVGNGGVMAAIRSYLLRRELRNYTKKFKAPKVAAEVPPRPDYETTRDAYLALRKELGIILHSFTKTMEPKTYFKHPVAGKLTIGQTLGFMEDHFDRHFEQVKERSK